MAKPKKTAEQVQEQAAATANPLLASCRSAGEWRCEECGLTVQVYFAEEPWVGDVEKGDCLECPQCAGPLTFVRWLKHSCQPKTPSE